MKTINKLRDRVRRTLGFVPFFSNYVFMDADAIYAHLEQEGAVEYIRNLRPSERKMLHFSIGMSIRNAYLLWHPNNPHTMRKLKALSEEQQANSPYHPDNYSWEIIRRLIVMADTGKTSKHFDIHDSLVYSLFSTDDDSEETLAKIRTAVADLIANERWDLLDDVYVEIVLFHASAPKLQALLQATSGYTTKLDPTNYLRVAKQAINKGVEIPRDDGI